MNPQNPKVDQYLIDGCGRCSFYKTPRCKVNDWREVLIELRSIVAETDLTEDLKWSFPTYTFNSSNVLILSAFREYASISFFKGVLLDDPKNLLQSPGENSQAVRLFKFTNVTQVKEFSEDLKSFIREAISLEVAGKKVEFKSENPDLPPELVIRFDEDPLLKLAFESLTPGRQRGYLLFFNGAKQTTTRASRIDKYVPLIMQGKGMNDERYKC
ncbi:MAG TPA: DUF1801 domain-containing protein [Anaerolineales bacterium]|nr:DUF1801 domain-containing protein [Anaerolineales bacterium]